MHTHLCTNKHTYAHPPLCHACNTPTHKHTIHCSHRHVHTHLCLHTHLCTYTHPHTHSSRYTCTAPHLHSPPPTHKSISRHTRTHGHSPHLHTYKRPHTHTQATHMYTYFCTLPTHTPPYAPIPTHPPQCLACPLGSRAVADGRGQERDALLPRAPLPPRDAPCSAERPLLPRTPVLPGRPHAPLLHPTCPHCRPAVTSEQPAHSGGGPVRGRSPVSTALLVGQQESQASNRLGEAGAWRLSMGTCVTRENHTYVSNSKGLFLLMKR